MKIKTVIISVGVTAAIIGGVILGIRIYSNMSKKPINVAAVSTLNESYWDMGSGSSSTIYGSIYSVESQVVQLRTDVELKEVLVTVGDQVKTGDVLLRYDATLPELKLEMEQLRHKLLELQLARSEKNLATINGGYLPQGYVKYEPSDEPSDTKTGSSMEGDLFEGELFPDDAIFEYGNDTAAGSDPYANSADSSDYAGDADLFADPSDPVDITGASDPYANSADSSDYAGDADLFADSSDPADYSGDAGLFADPSYSFDGSGGFDALPASDSYTDSQGLFADSGDLFTGDPSGSGDADLFVDEPSADDTLDDSIFEGENGDTFLDYGGVGSGSLVPDNTGSETNPSSGDSSTSLITGDGDLLLDEAVWQGAFDLGTNQETDPDGSRKNTGGLFDGGGAKLPADRTDLQIVTDVNAFFTQINLLRTQREDQMRSEDIEYAMHMFEQNISDSQSVSITQFYPDLVGLSRDVKVYNISSVVASSGLMTENYQETLYQGYIWACMYNYLDKVRKLEEVLEAADLDPSTMTTEQLYAYSPALGDVLTAYYHYRANALRWSMDGASSMERSLGRLANDLYIAYIVPSFNSPSSVITGMARRLELLYAGTPLLERETEEPFTEDEFDFGGLGDLSEATMTPEERAEAIAYLLIDIREQKLQIRESNLELAKRQLEVDDTIVKSKIDGVVTVAGDLDSGAYDQFIVISDGKGKHARGSVSELKLDTVHVGDKITGNSIEDYSRTFTAVITEISAYPQDNNNMYYGWGSENQNVSYYPFYATIEDGNDLPDGDAEMKLQTQKESTGIFLPNYLIRTDSNGQYFVYMEDPDGLLTKKIIQTGRNMSGYATEILSGLSEDDFIAFPYGKGVEPGAKTEEVDNLFTGNDLYYG